MPTTIKVSEKNYHSSLVESSYLYIYEIWLVKETRVFSKVDNTGLVK